MSGRPDIVAAARGWIGTPYRHQASAKGLGADCLGLVRGVWREVIGPETARLPAYTADWGEARGEELLWRGALQHLCAAGPEVAPGDVLLFRMRDGRIAKHLGIAATSQSFVHAYSGHGVLETALSAPWARRIVARFTFPEGTA
ncbi:MAG: NlpC/P60 family protein [Pseudomonadota bacterium]